MPKLNVAIAGKHIALLPHCEKFVNVRHKWMQSKRNRLKVKSNPPSFDEEMQLWEQWSQDDETFLFMVSDMHKWMHDDEQMISCLVGEVLLTLVKEKDFNFCKLDVLMLDTSVRRRAMLSESVIFALQFAYSSLKADFVIVHPGNPSPTRLTFTARDDEPEEEPAKRGLSSRVAAGMTLLRNAARGATIKAKSDVLQKLTKHLQGADENDAWPEQLDFYLTDEDDLVLDFVSDTMAQLDQWSQHAQFYKFSSIEPDHRMRLPGHVRLNGKTITLLPYRQEHVKKVHQLMQLSTVHAAFKVPPPSIDEEARAQRLLAKDPGCYAFVICHQEQPGMPSCPVTIAGRAQVMLEHGQAQIYIGVGADDSAVAAVDLQETFLLLLYFVYAATLVKTIVLPADLDPSQGLSHTRWATLCRYTSDGEQKTLDLSQADIKAALLKLCSKIAAEMEGYDPQGVKYQSATSI
eukprot:TRINITY_DN11869_c2_g1_i1.p1 TRINITY_DN11869_c2_g1~~TRINITY_DN11869_c2_g1_i1.p1  ORF type:complete len:462 (+),score=122.57 TRINITY_DN11869_c2_g1_i1:304-1689(+)